MHIEELQNGDVVYAAVSIANDGSVPDAEEGEVFASPGTRGMLLNTGYLEEEPDTTLYLVCFENGEGELGQPITCLAEELSTEAS